MTRGEGGAARQAAALRREGVEVERNAMGELTIDLATYGWFPDFLPSEAAEHDEDEEDADEGT
jgi:methylated-DNA-protein-cysteine methyltransferase-like protein